MNVNIDCDRKINKELLCFHKTAVNEVEDGCFQYGDLHENGHLLSTFPFSDLRKDLRRSQSLNDLKDHSSESETAIDSDHAHQEHPEEFVRLRLTKPTQQESVESESLGVENIDQGASSNMIREPNSLHANLEIKEAPDLLNAAAVLSDYYSIDRVDVCSVPFKLIVDEETDKDESNSTENSSSSRKIGKATNLRIHISNSSGTLENQSSNEYESETGIPNSPTLYISGVSISRSPEPRSPKSQSLDNKENRSPSLTLSLSTTPEPRTKKNTSPLPIYTRSRSSSLIVPSSIVSGSPKPNPKKGPYSTDYLQLSSISLQAVRASSPFFLTEPRISRSASETEKGRSVFQFPKSPTDGVLSSILHVEESNLSSDDFHEALFLGKCKRKKSKRERNKEKDPKEKVGKSDKEGKVRKDSKGKEKTKDNSKDMKDKEMKERKRSKEFLSVV